MKIFFRILMLLFVSIPTFGAELKLLQGAGKCPPFSFESENDWHLKSDRKKGDRWILLDANNNEMVRIVFKLPTTDQKQLPEVETKVLHLSSFHVEKYTVTTSFPEKGTPATEGLITSYSFKKGRLQGLVFMSSPYSKNSGLDKKIEKLIRSIKLL